MYSLSGNASVFIGWVMAIQEAAWRMRCAVLSQAAVKTLELAMTFSKLISQFKEELNSLGGLLKVSLVWASGHRNMEENKLFGELA